MLERNNLKTKVMKSIELQVLESYFSEKAEGEKNGEYKFRGTWYQVQPASYVDNLPDDHEFAWIKEEPRFLYNDEYYYIIKQ